MKLAGFDGLVFSGRLPRPKYVLVKEGESSLGDGEWLWGRRATDTMNALRARHGYIGALSIGTGALLADAAEALIEAFGDDNLCTSIRWITIQNANPRVEPAWDFAQRDGKLWRLGPHLGLSRPNLFFQRDSWIEVAFKEWTRRSRTISETGYSKTKPSGWARFFADLRSFDDGL